MQLARTAHRGGRQVRGMVAEGNEGQPLVSVVTAIYNGQPYVARCLDSVIQQNYPNIEHIIIDGGSTDGTLNVLRQYDDRVALWISEPDAGVYDAWNKGLAQAHGEWICFLGADDEFLPNAVSAYMVLASEHPDAEYLCSRGRLVKASGYQRLFGLPWTWKRFSCEMCAAHPGSMHRRRLFDRFGNFDVSYRIAGDYEFLLRARDGLNAAYMPVVTVMMRDGGLSAAYAFRCMEESRKAKTTTGGRSVLAARLEEYKLKARILVRPLLHAMGFRAERA